LEEEQIRNTPNIQKKNESIILQSPFQLNNMNENNGITFMPHVIMG